MTGEWVYSSTRDERTQTIKIADVAGQPRTSTISDQDRVLQDQRGQDRSGQDMTRSERTGQDAEERTEGHKRENEECMRSEIRREFGRKFQGAQDRI